MSYWMYSWTARGPVILRMSSTYQFHSQLFLLPMRLRRRAACIQTQSNYNSRETKEVYSKQPSSKMGIFDVLIMIKQHDHAFLQDSNSPVSKLVALEAAPHFSPLHFSAGGHSPLVLLAKGYLSLAMALRLVACRVATYSSRERLTRVRLSRCRWQTVRSSLSCSFTALISLFLEMMKFISALESPMRESNLAASALACSICPQRVRQRSFSADNCLTFSRIQFSIFFFSSSLEAMWNCHSWQSFSLLAMVPWLMEMAVSSSEILASSPAFQSQSWERVSVRLLSYLIRERMQLWVLWVRSERSLRWSLNRPFSRFPRQTSQRTWPTCSLVLSCSIPLTSSKLACSCPLSRASLASSSFLSAISAHCCTLNLASLNAPIRTFNSYPSIYAWERSSCTLRTVSYSLSWLLLTLVSWSLISPSRRALALRRSSLTRSYRSCAEASASLQVWRVAIMAFLWSSALWKSSRTGLRVALLPFRSRLIFEQKKIMSFCL